MDCTLALHLNRLHFDRAQIWFPSYVFRSRRHGNTNNKLINIATRVCYSHIEWYNILVIVAHRRALRGTCLSMFDDAAACSLDAAAAGSKLSWFIVACDTWAPLTEVRSKDAARPQLCRLLCGSLCCSSVRCADMWPRHAMYSCCVGAA